MTNGQHKYQRSAAGDQGNSKVVSMCMVSTQYIWMYVNYQHWHTNLAANQANKQANQSVSQAVK